VARVVTSGPIFFKLITSFFNCGVEVVLVDVVVEIWVVVVGLLVVVVELCLEVVGLFVVVVDAM
jgi:hypothetical protein